MANLKITVITCTYNSEKYLAECIESVLSQSYKNVEHLFIDGKSSDRTIDIIKKYYSNPVIYSEKDKGIYDALNKGLLKATGEVIGCLHSDDVFFDQYCLSRVAHAFKKEKIAFYCSKMLVYDVDLKDLYAILGAFPHKYSFREQLYSSTYYAHPTYYCRREVIDKVGKYNLKYKIASDIDWLIRLEKLNLPYYFDHRPMVKLRSSGKSAKHYFRAIFEEFMVNKKHNGLSLSLITVYMFHLLRRSIRFLLEILKLQGVITFCRKIIFKKLRKLKNLN